MTTESPRVRESLGLDLLSGQESFIKDLSAELEASITGGGGDCSSSNTGSKSKRVRKQKRSRSRSRSGKGYSCK